METVVEEIAGTIGSAPVCIYFATAGSGIIALTTCFFIPRPNGILRNLTALFWRELSGSRFSALKATFALP